MERGMRIFTIGTIRALRKKIIAVWIGYTGIQVPLTVKSSGEEWRRSVGPLSLSRVSRFLRLRLSRVYTTSPVVTFFFFFLFTRPWLSGDLLAVVISVERTDSKYLSLKWFDIRVLETFQIRETISIFYPCDRRLLFTTKNQAAINTFNVLQLIISEHVLDFFLLQSDKYHHLCLCRLWRFSKLENRNRQATAI